MKVIKRLNNLDDIKSNGNNGKLPNGPIDYEKLHNFPKFLGIFIIFILLETNNIQQQSKQSKTFKVVGPNVDSTIDSKGKKFSTYMKNEKKEVKPGYYGVSRLT